MYEHILMKWIVGKELVFKNLRTDSMHVSNSNKMINSIVVGSTVKLDKSSENNF